MTAADPFIQSDTDNRSASVIQIESSRLLPWLILAALLSGFAVAFSIFAMIRATDATTAASVLQIYVSELESKISQE